MYGMKKTPVKKKAPKKKPGMYTPKPVKKKQKKAY